MSKEIFDVAIIGAGPAGLIAAHDLADRNIVVVEKGGLIPTRVSPTEGVAGAGGGSNGTLTLSPAGILNQYVGDDYREEAEAVSQKFRGFLGGEYVEPTDNVGTCIIEGTSLTQEVPLVSHLGTSTIQQAFQGIYEEVINAGNDVRVNDGVVEIVDGTNSSFLLRTAFGDEIQSQHLIVATGKSDLTLVPQLVGQYQLPTAVNAPTIGFRLVVPNDELAEMKANGANPKLKRTLKNGDTVKTHCFTYAGEIVIYNYGQNVLVEGRSDLKSPTDTASVNIFYKYSSHPEIGKREAHKMLVRIREEHPGKVIYQDMPSFLNPNQKPHETNIPIIERATLARIDPYYPPQVVAAIREFIPMMARHYGVNLDRAAILGPSAEWLNDAVQADKKTMSTSRQGLYIIGDGAGITQGIIAAGVTGRRAAQSIKQRLA